MLICPILVLAGVRYRQNPELRGAAICARKLALKLAQRIGLACLPPRLPAWRYQRRCLDIATTLGSASASGTLRSLSLTALQLCMLTGVSCRPEQLVPWSACLLQQ